MSEFVIFIKKFLKSKEFLMLIFLCASLVFFDGILNGNDQYKVGIVIDTEIQENREFYNSLLNSDSIFKFEKQENSEIANQNLVRGEIIGFYKISGNIKNLGLEDSKTKIEVFTKENSVLTEISDEIIFSKSMGILQYQNLTEKLHERNYKFDEKALKEKYDFYKNSDETFKFESERQKFSGSRLKKFELEKISYLFIILFSYFGNLEFLKLKDEKFLDTVYFKRRRKVSNSALFSPFVVTFLTVILFNIFWNGRIDFIFLSFVLIISVISTKILEKIIKKEKTGLFLFPIYILLVFSIFLFLKLNLLI